MVLGPNGAGKTTLLQVAAAMIHPTDGVAGILGEVLGTVDVFELRPRIGVTSAALAERIPRDERVRDVVVSASYGIVGRWRESYDDLDHERADELLAEVGVQPAGRPHVRHPERGRAQAGADRAGADDRPRAAAARRAGRRVSTSVVARTSSRRCRVLASAHSSPATVLVSHHVEEIPPGFTHAMLLRDGQVVAAGPMDEVITEANLTATFRMPLVLTHEAGRFAARRRSPSPSRVALCGRDPWRRADRVGAWTGWVTTRGPAGSRSPSCSASPSWSAST